MIDHSALNGRRKFRLAEIKGTGNDDILPETAAADTIEGFDGNASMTGLGGGDLIYAGSGNDTVDTGADNDTVLGETGNDAFSVQSGDDVSYGGDGRM